MKITVFSVLYPFISRVINEIYVIQYSRKSLFQRGYVTPPLFNSKLDIFVHLVDFVSIAIWPKPLDFYFS